jgi:hypothetical protein
LALWDLRGLRRPRWQVAFLTHDRESPGLNFSHDARGHKSQVCRAAEGSMGTLTEAAVKVDTFNFTRYGLVHGKVVTLSQDAIPRDGGPTSDPLKQGATDDAAAEPAYAARVSLDQTQMQIDDKLLDLSPGIAVTVESKTGTRRIIDYLLSPILRHSQESLRER